MWERCFATAPTLFEMDILLSLRITIKFFLNLPALLSPSKARPPVIEPSPITATVYDCSPLSCFALAIPYAAEIDVDE